MQPDTTMGGRDGAFPITNWSAILSLADPAAPEYRMRLEQLIQQYWKPVYLYVRARWRKSNEEAKDLTQAFFARLIETQQLSALPEELGSFRAFLKSSLRNFLIDDYRREKTREAIRPVQHLEVAGEELRGMETLLNSAAPEEAFETQWTECLLASTIETLRQELEKEGKGRYFDVFRMYCLDPNQPSSLGEPAESPPPEDLSYLKVGQTLGLKPTDVRNYLAYCRKRAREILRDQVKDTVANEEEWKREIERILGS